MTAQHVLTGIGKFRGGESSCLNMYKTLRSEVNFTFFRSESFKGGHNQDGG
jgi:hypothetical protein